MATLSDRLRFSVWMLMVPASPLPVVSTEIFPSPEISIFSGARIFMLPPLPMEVLRAETKPFSVNSIFRLGLFLYGFRVRVPAGLSPAVSANIPSFPDMSRLLALMVMLPPASWLLAPSSAVALIWAFCPIVSFLVFISMFPASPALLVSVVRLVPFSRVKSMVLILIWPALPWSSVEAFILTPLDILRLLVLISIIPALPVPDVSVAMNPWPVISMFFGAWINMLPPFPLDEVEAEMKPSFLKVMSRSGSFW